MSRVKIIFNSRIYSLGGFPDTYEELLRKVKDSIGALSHYATLHLTYKDLDGEILHLTTTYALKEIYRHLQGSTLRLEVKPGRAYTAKTTARDTENTYSIKSAIMAMRAVFKIMRGLEILGLGVLINKRVGLMSSRIVPNREMAYAMMAVFEDEKVECALNPDELFVVNEDIAICAFKATYQLQEIDPLVVDPGNINPEGSTIIAIHNPIHDDPKWAFKWLEIREQIGSRIYYESLEPCGLTGAPIFDEDWKLLGLQLSSVQTQNESIRWSGVLDMLKEAPYTLIVSQLIESIEPRAVTNENEEYRLCVTDTPEPTSERVYTLNCTQGKLLGYNVRTNEHSEYPLENRLGEGAALAVFPTGLMITGGKSSLRKSFIMFFKGEKNLYETDMPNAHYTHCSIFFEGWIFVIGGRNSGRPITTTDSYDFQKQNWIRLPPIREERSYPACSVIGGKLYIFGGTNPNEDSESVEIYDTNRWKYCDLKMPMRLQGVGLIPINESKVMLIGGRSEGSKHNNKIYTFDFERSKYTLHESTHRAGICSTSQPLVTQDAYYFYNAECELLKWWVHGKTITRIARNTTVSFI